MENRKWFSSETVGNRRGKRSIFEMLKERANPAIMVYTTGIVLRKNKTKTLYRQTKTEEVCHGKATLQAMLKRISNQRKMTSNGKV